jgi:nitroreductase
MTLHLSVDEVLNTTRAVRKRLDLTRPVEREVLLECLELAVQAPSGSNSQRWHWVFVTDPAKKTAIADIYRTVFDATYTADAMARDDASRRVYDSARYLADHFAEVPVMLLPCSWGRPDAGGGGGNQAGYWGSLLPAAWSFMLAARERGLGTAWTTMHLRHEEEVADILGIPFDRCAQGGLFPIAYTLGTDFKPGPRIASDDIVHWDQW